GRKRKEWTCADLHIDGKSLFHRFDICLGPPSSVASFPLCGVRQTVTKRMAFRAILRSTGAESLIATEARNAYRCKQRPRILLSAATCANSYLFSSEAHHLDAT